MGTSATHCFKEAASAECVGQGTVEGWIGQWLTSHHNREVLLQGDFYWVKNTDVPELSAILMDEICETFCKLKAKRGEEERCCYSGMDGGCLAHPVADWRQRGSETLHSSASCCKEAEQKQRGVSVSLASAEPGRTWGLSVALKKMHFSLNFGWASVSCSQELH